MKIARRVTLSLLVSAVAFLAGFIIALNFYTTWTAFAHEAASRRSAFTWGFVVAGMASVLAFGVALYLMRSKKSFGRNSKTAADPGR